MTPRTVLHLSPSSRLLGARRSLLQLVTNLDPARYRPVVATQSPGALVDALREAGVQTHILPLGWWRKGRDMLLRPFCIPRLAKMIRETGADIVHCNEFYPNPYAVRASIRAGGLPVVTHMRLSITPRQVELYNLDRAARVVCVSEAAARDFEVWNQGERNRRVRVIYNGVDLDAFRPALGKEEARRRLGLNADDFVAGQFALLSPRKRQRMLIDAADRLRDSVPNLRILIVGSPGKSDAPYATELKKAVSEKGLESVVRFVDFTPDVVPLYEACNVNVLISNDEGFGRTPIEAGALGIPSIGSSVGGIPEVIADGETGILIEPDDETGRLAEALAAIARDPERHATMGRAARKRAETVFSIDRHVEAMMDVFDEVLQGSQAGLTAPIS